MSYPCWCFWWYEASTWCKHTWSPHRFWLFKIPSVYIKHPVWLSPFLASTLTSNDWKISWTLTHGWSKDPSFHPCFSLRNDLLLAIWRFPKMEVPLYMDALKGKILLRWMIWGYPYFRKPPYYELFISMNRWKNHDEPLWTTVISQLSTMNYYYSPLQTTILHY